MVSYIHKFGNTRLYIHEITRDLPERHRGMEHLNVDIIADNKHDHNFDVSRFLTPNIKGKIQKKNCH